MKTGSILQSIGFGLLAVTFGISLWKVFTYTTSESDPSLRTIRIAHWQLEDGAAAAIDAAAREYERLNPGVRIIQMRVPEKVYPNWVTTQLVGGTAPDLIQIGKGIDQARMARFFEPISDEVVKPNPYNEGTALEGIPWRETYIDGMIGGFDEMLQDYYGAPLFMATVRMYYNRTLMQRITGEDRPPRNLGELLILAERTREYAAEQGIVLVPIAGSRYNAPILIERIFRTMTQRMVQDLSARRQFQVEFESLLLGLNQGVWDLTTPALAQALELASQLGRHMQPGFMQLDREDATFLFEQGRALTVATGSWDATTLFNRPRFPVGVFDLPAPSPDHPEYGQFVLGRHSEAGVRAYGPFGIPRTSANPDVALDFMRFITSLPGNQLFAEKSGWVPVILGVKPVPEIAPFTPVFDGYPDGFYFAQTPDVARIMETNMHMLFTGDDGVARFLRNVAGPLQTAAKSDLVRLQRNRVVQLVRSDLTVTANEMLISEGGGDEEGLERRARAQRERQLAAEAAHAHFSSVIE